MKLIISCYLKQKTHQIFTFDILANLIIKIVAY